MMKPGKADYCSLAFCMLKNIPQSTGNGAYCITPRVYNTPHTKVIDR